MAENSLSMPLSSISRPTYTKNFQSNSNEFETVEDINLKILAFAHHMSGLNWKEKFGYCSISGSVAPSSMKKYWAPLATILVEKKIFEKKL